MMEHLLESVRDRVNSLMEPEHEHVIERLAKESVCGGKLLRPRLLIAAAGSEVETDTLVRAGAAVELVHASLLIHDDLIDGDRERRGKPSVAFAAEVSASRSGLAEDHAERIGLTAAVVTGDILLARGLGEVARIDLPIDLRRKAMDIVDRAMSAAATGEFDDVWHAGQQPEEGLITSLLERKTADYSFRAPLELGALIGGRPDAVVERLGSVGLRMGVLYQLRDDVLGTFGDAGITGKSALSDLKTGAPTMLVHLASQSASWNAVADHWGDSDADFETLTRIRVALTESGALEQLHQRMEHEVLLLRQEIASIALEAHARSELERLLLRTVERAR
ncbi:MAG TPA: polyprenyl synthetase family protein [Candidatus Agrococcus pullicola]|uniref:Polyprenyl synthetase family protein n=1 Tax=Candidatus Agrococcus pullicola TaxID=2838429 RepID=A0A9D1YSW8_9MICO|nr:polyprenyl synthetase family protein [Candidatus Agrococcus pullicola]